MSVESDLRAALAGYAPLAAIAGTRIAINAMEQGAAPPFVVFSSSHQRDLGLDGTVLGDDVSIELQCWAATAVQASALADAVDAALRAVTQAEPLARATGYDAETGLDVEVITAQLLIG